MMKSEDMRAVNRLERNAKRLEKVRLILESVYRENDVSGLDIRFTIDKIINARDSIIEMRDSIVK